MVTAVTAGWLAVSVLGLLVVILITNKFGYAKRGFDKREIRGVGGILLPTMIGLGMLSALSVVP